MKKNCSKLHEASTYVHETYFVIFFIIKICNLGSKIVQFLSTRFYFIFM